MSALTLLLFIPASIPIWLPLVVARWARGSTMDVRIVLGVSGVVAGLYAAYVLAQIASLTGTAHSWPLLLIPVTTAALSFFCAFTGICLTTALSYVFSGRVASLPCLLAGVLTAASVALGIRVVFPFLLLPLQSLPR